MERFPVEVLYVLGFLAIVLFNYLVQRAARRRQQQENTQAGVPPSPPAAPSIEEELPEDIWGRRAAPPPSAPAPVLVPRPVPPAAPPPAPRRPHPVRALLKDKRDLRRAVVLMMVLSPCRAQERKPTGPYGSPD
jgi:hypothetical protein